MAFRFNHKQGSQSQDVYVLCISIEKYYGPAIYVTVGPVSYHLEMEWTVTDHTDAFWAYIQLKMNNKAVSVMFYIVQW